jgi:S1-C subfamily serine protease
MSRFWQHFVSDGHGGKECHELGFRGHAVPILPSLRERLSLTQLTGIEIWRIRRGRAMADAGCRHGDIIVAISGRAVADSVELVATLRRSPAGSAVPIIVLRNDKLLERLVVPDQYFGTQQSS